VKSGVIHMALRWFCVCAIVGGIAFGDMLPVQAGSAQASENGKRALQLLNSENNSVTHGMARGDLAILRATSELRTGAPDQAISTLEQARKQDKALADDPLAAVIEAEAHRRSAILAVARAGDYARVLVDEKKRLQAVDLSPGMAEADQRLRAFIDRVDGVYGEPLDLLELSSAVKSVFLVDKGRSRM